MALLTQTTQQQHLQLHIRYDIVVAQLSPISNSTFLFDAASPGNFCE